MDRLSRRRLAKNGTATSDLGRLTIGLVYLSVILTVIINLQFSFYKLLLSRSSFFMKRSFLLLFLVSTGFAEPPMQAIQRQVAALQSPVIALQRQVTSLQQNKVLALAPFVSVAPDPQIGVRVPHTTHSLPIPAISP